MSAAAPATVPATTRGLTSRYELGEAIGAGGEAVVYAARDLTLGREVAIKLVRPEHAHDPATGRDLLAEAQATGRLEHPGVVPVHEAGADPDRGTFLAMKRVRGRTLTQEIDAAHDRVRQDQATQTVEERRLLEATVKVCDTLAYVHSRGVLHRDLKADNVMVGEFGEVHVMDFGLARQAKASTPSGMVQGTPRTMAPEQAAGRADLDERVDVYAVGALLFHMVAGAPPFAGLKDVGDVLAAVRSGKAGRPSRAPQAWRVPLALESIVLRAMARAREARYATVADLASDVRAYLAGERVSAHREGPLERVAREARRRPRLVVGAAVAVVCLGIGALALVRAQGQAALREATARQEAADAARATLAEAARQEAEAALARLAARDGDPGVRTGLALGAVQAAQRWHDLATAPARPQAARALFDAAHALGEVALATAQWDLAERAFSLERGLGVDDAGAEADVRRAAEARTAEARRRRAEIEGWLARATSGELSTRPDGLTDAVFAIVRYPEAQTVELLAAALAPVTSALLAAEADLFRSGALPDPDEARTGGRPIEGVEEALALRSRGVRWHDLPAETRGALERAGARATLRHYRSLSAEARGSAPDVLRLLAARQGEALGPGRLALAGVCCDAVGRVADASTHGPALAALGAYLDAEADQLRAGRAGVALARGCGQEGRRMAIDARQRLGRDGAYAALVSGELVRRAASPASSADLLGRTEQLNRATERDPDDVNTLRQRAQLRLDMGDTRGALVDLDALVTLEPNNASMRAGRALARDRAGDLDGALADLDRALELSPQYAGALVDRGALRWRRGDRRGALADYDRALELEPRSTLALRSRGAIRQEVGDLTGSLADLDRAIELDPDHADSYVNRGVTRKALGDLNGAIADYDRAIERDPGGALAFQNRGLARTAQGDRAGALLDFDRAIALAPRSVGPLGARGDVRRAAGDLTGAIADYDAVLALDPSDRSARQNRGVARLSLGDARGAFADSDRVIQLDPAAADAYNNRALARRALGDLRGALQDLDRALELAPDDPWTRASRGLVLHELGEHARAIPDLDWALRRSPGFVAAWVARARARQAAGDLAGARSDLDRAIELEPGHSVALNTRGSVRRAQGDLQGALADFDRALALDPRDADILANRGAIRQRQGDLAAALADYDRAIESDPRHVGAHTNRGLLRAARRDLRGAIADYDRAIELDPRAANAWFNRGVARHASGDLRAALQDFDQAVALDPGNPSAWKNRAVTRRQLADAAGAAADFARFVELAPDDPQAAAITRLIEQLRSGGR